MKYREPVSDCMICKDLDPKTEFYIHTSSSSSSNDDDEHMRQKRQADYSYESDYTNTDSDNDNINAGKDDQENNGKDKREDDDGKNNDGKDKGEDDDEKDNYGKNMREDNEKEDEIVPFFRRHEYHRRPYHHERPKNQRRHNHHSHKNAHEKTRVTLPSGTVAYINKYDDMMRSFQCGSKTILLELHPSDAEFKLMEKEMQSTIQVHGGIKFSKYNIKKMERVVNGCLMRRYRRRQEAIESEFRHLNQRMFFHGTANADDLVASGFDERFSKISGMFGAGVYFAEHSSKSNQYAFGFRGQCPKHGERHCMVCERKMLICRVTLGNIYKVTQAQKQIANPPPDFHSVEGVASNAPKGLKYNEYIIYRGEQYGNGCCAEQRRGPCGEAGGADHPELCMKKSGLTSHDVHRWPPSKSVAILLYGKVSLTFKPHTITIKLNNFYYETKPVRTKKITVLTIRFKVCTNAAGSSTEAPNHTCAWPKYRLVTKSPSVRMPSGANEFISQFEWSSKNIIMFVEIKTKMRAEGEREYAIIVREMQNSIHRHVNCQNAGGCFSNYNIEKVLKLVGTRLWNKYTKRREEIVSQCGDANERMLFHGSYFSFPISVAGFDIQYANKNGLFGAAIYFAEESSKSNQYVYGYMGGDGCSEHKDKNCRICTRIMLLCRVALGRVYTVTTDHDEGVTVTKELPAGYHSIQGVPSRGGLRFPEYAIYQGAQAYPEYLIIYKIN